MENYVEVRFVASHMYIGNGRKNNCAKKVMPSSYVTLAQGGLALRKTTWDG
jgi:hypothetical protein